MSKSRRIVRKLTHGLLLETLSYSRRTGEFRWRVSRVWTKKSGEIAGGRMVLGYIVIGLMLFGLTHTSRETY